MFEKWKIKVIIYIAHILNIKYKGEFNKICEILTEKYKALLTELEKI